VIAVGSYLPGLGFRERAPDCKGLRGQIRAVRVRSVKVSSGQFISGDSSCPSRTTVIRDTTVYIDTTGTTYTQLQRGPHLNFFFFISLPTPKQPAVVFGLPIPPFSSIAYREARGNMTGNRALPAGRASSRTMFNWNVIRVVTLVSRRVSMHTNRLRDRKTKSHVLLCYHLTYDLLVWWANQRYHLSKSCELCAITPVMISAVRVMQMMQHRDGTLR
jgi:hypothetical protein